MNNLDNESQISAADSAASEDKPKNVGAGPVKFVADGGVEGEAKQPIEHTGKLTGMGGATGGTAGLPDASEGNDNTSRE